MTHLLHMDTLKLFTSKEEKLAEQLQLVKRYTEDIEMQFRLDKCAKCTFVQGEPTKTDTLKIDRDTTIQELEKLSIIQIPRIRRGPLNMSQPNAQNNYQRMPAKNEAVP